MMLNIQTALDESVNNKKIRVIIVSADGPTFSAGHDLKELTEGRQNPDKGKLFYNNNEKMFKINANNSNNPKPVIAEVNGTATAAGCYPPLLAAILHMQVNQAAFATPGVNIGLFCSTPMVAVSRNVSNKHSMEMLLTGDFISATKAEKIGLINKAVDESLLKKETMEVAQKISKKSAITLKIGKEAFYKQIDMTLSEAYDYASDIMVENICLKSSTQKRALALS